MTQLDTIIFSILIVGTPGNHFVISNFVAEHTYPSQSLVKFAFQNQGESLFLEGVGMFNHEIRDQKHIFVTSRYKIRKACSPIRLYTWGEVVEVLGFCRA